MRPRYPLWMSRDDGYEKMKNVKIDPDPIAAVGPKVSRPALLGYILSVGEISLGIMMFLCLVCVLMIGLCSLIFDDGCTTLLFVIFLSLALIAEGRWMISCGREQWRAERRRTHVSSSGDMRVQQATPDSTGTALEPVTQRVSRRRLLVWLFLVALSTYLNLNIEYCRFATGYEMPFKEPSGKWRFGSTSEAAIRWQVAESVRWESFQDDEQSPDWEKTRERPLTHEEERIVESRLPKAILRAKGHNRMYGALCLAQLQYIMVPILLVSGAILLLVPRPRRAIVWAALLVLLINAFMMVCRGYHASWTMTSR